jgi:hypothetical protein
MASKVEQRTYEEALSWLRDHGFDLLEAPGTQARVFLRKYNVSAAIQKNGDDGVKIFAYPGYLIGSEISKLVNKGYQQFLKTAKTEVPATADHLESPATVHRGNERRLGLAHSVQRIARHGQRIVPLRPHREPRQARCDRPKRPWEKAGVIAAAAKEGPRLESLI